MMQKESHLLIADNSNVKEVSIIGKPGNSNRKFVDIGSFVTATVKKVRPNTIIKKGEIVMVLIVATKKGYVRSDNSRIKFSGNYAVLVKKEDKQLIGSRIFVPILREFGKWGYQKMLSLAPKII